MDFVNWLTKDYIHCDNETIVQCGFFRKIISFSNSNICFLYVRFDCSFLFLFLFTFCLFSVNTTMINNKVRLCACGPTCRISSICVTEGGTRARGRVSASSNFTLKAMVFLKCSRASCRTEGSFPCRHQGQGNIRIQPHGRQTVETSKTLKMFVYLNRMKNGL